MKIILNYKWLLFSLLMVTFLCHSQESSSLGKPLIEHYPAHIYNGNEINWSMVIADSGYLYSGNGDGVLEYDGNKWRLIKTTNSGAVVSLCKTKDGLIYVGANSSFGYLEKNQYGQIDFIDISTKSAIKDKNFGEVKTVFCFDQSVYFAANKWLFRLNQDKTISSWFYQDESLFTDVFAFNNKVYITSQKHTFQINQADKLEITKQFVDENKKRIHVIETIKSENIELLFSMNNVYVKENIFQPWQTKAAKILNKTWMYDTIRYNSKYIAVATIRKGVFLISNDGSEVINISQKQGLPNEISLAIAADNQDGLWVGNMDKGISRIQSPLDLRIDNDNLGLTRINKIINYKNNLISMSFTDLSLIGDSNNSRLKFNKDQFETIVDSKINGLLVGGYFGIDLVEIDFEQFNNSNVTSIISETIGVKEIIASSNDNHAFFVRLKEGLGYLQFVSGSWNYKHLIDFKKEIISMIIDDTGLWLSFYGGQIKHIKDFSNVTNLKFDTYMIDNSSKQYNTQIFQNLTGSLFTQFNKIYNFNTDTKNFDLIAKINSNTAIEFIQQDKQGQYWLANKTDIMLFKDESFINGDTDLSNYLNSALTLDIFFDDQNQRTYLIRNDGLVILDKKLNLLSPVLPKINSIKSNGEFLPFQDNQILSGDYEQHDLQFNISMTNFSYAASNEFQLCFSDKNCSSWSNNTSINFNNIDGGTHDIILYSRDKYKQKTMKRYQISVAKYWYQTLWFKILATIIALLSVYVISKFSTYRLEKRNQKLEALISKRTKTIEDQAQELHQLDEARLRFFSNVSHEFRTPLTLAIAPLESLLQDKPNLEQDIAHPVKTALTNSKKMLLLIGQILDIKRLESGSFPLRVSQYNVSKLFQQLVERFKPWANKNHQNISTHNEHEKQTLYFDQEQIDRCLSNLISNAIKYSGNGSEITLSIQNKDNWVGLSVKDTGIGISHESKDKVFDRYYQDKHSENISNAGTGIGLSLVDELMQLHHGKVELINQSGLGCEFILWLKKGNDHFDKQQLTERVNYEVAPINSDIKIQMPKKSAKANQEDITTVLVVDDNHELCDFIDSRLCSYYHVLQEHNGVDGLATANKELPDLIISDVMMPQMNGLEMSVQLKQNIATQSIPIILLTAKSSKREVVKGLQTGADDYLSKPFDSSELIMRVAGLINNRKRIRETLQLEFAQTKIPLNNKQDFLQEFTSKVNKNLSNPSFSIEELAKDLKLSQSSLQRKCKQKFNATPIECIRKIRMDSALQLLKEEKYTISEIAYGTGFESLSYFSRIFKKHYGENPSAYKTKQLVKNNSSHPESDK